MTKRFKFTVHGIIVVGDHIFFSVSFGKKNLCQILEYRMTEWGT